MQIKNTNNIRFVQRLDNLFPTLFCYILVVFTITSVKAQLNVSFVDAASLAIGGNTTCSSSQQSILNNPALFAKEKGNATLLSAGVQNRFQLAELNIFSAGAMYKKKDQMYGVQVNYAGVPDFKEYGVGISYGRKLFSKLAIGTRVHFSQLDLAVYGKKSLLDADLGLYSALNKQVSFGFWAKNLIHSKIAEDENNQTSLHLGFCYSPSDKVKFCAEAAKSFTNNPKFSAGIEYLPMKNIALRAGFQSFPAMPSFGVGYQIKTIKIDLSAAIHPNLGLISAVNFAYSL